MRNYPSQAIRNVVLLSHRGDGKTSLAEMLLLRTGAIDRLGRIEDGTTVSDYEPEEAQRGGSVNLSILPVEWKDLKINVLDPPGYVDFIGETIGALRVADGALVLVDASTGPQVGTDMLWRRAESVSKPRLIMIDKMDRENADFRTALASIQDRYSKACIAVHLPIGSQHEFEGVIDVLSGRAHLADGATADAPESLSDEINDLREQLIEAVADTDETLATKYLEGEDLGPVELMTALVGAVREGKIFPVIAGSGLLGHGVDAVLDAIIRLLPGPNLSRLEPANSEAGEPVELKTDSEGPLAALVFKTTTDAFVGKLSYFRVYSGAFKSHHHVWNSDKGVQERVGQLVVHSGKNSENVDTLLAGDIGAVSKLAATTTGDTLTTREEGLSFAKFEFPEPIYHVAIHPKSKVDTDKLGACLSRLIDEDPSLRIDREDDTHEIILSGLGDGHIDVAVHKLFRKFGVEVEVGAPKIPYKESIRIYKRAEYKHKKQTGGHGQYGHVVIEIEPLERGAGFVFDDRVVGGSVPKNFIPAVEKGIREALPQGAIAHFPIVDLRATLVDGSFHANDSNEMAFKIAASMALRKGIQEAEPVILEPFMNVEVVCPDDFTGDVIGHLNGIRAKVHGVNTESGVTIVQAEAPMAEMLRYSTDLRSMTQGRGSYTMSFSHYEDVPEHLTSMIVAEANEERETR
jgi:elongation factor G